MALDWLKDPISEDAPCGPDLEQSDDGPFVDYYYEAESQMPERYFTPGMKSKTDEVSIGVLFDRKSIDHKSELASITALLKRTRDVRLLSLLARFMILAGRLGDFADAVSGMADVLETFPDHVHPLDPTDRRGAIDELGSTVAVCFPLQYTELAGPGEVSLRRYQVASGASGPREGELGITTSKLVGELGAPGNRKPVEEAHKHLTVIASSLARIRSACLRHSEKPFNPSIEPAENNVSEMMDLIHMGRTDLVPWSAEPKGAADVIMDDVPMDAGNDDAGSPAVSAAPVAVATTVALKISSRAAAVQVIQSIEVYFATYEPTSAALILVTQARLLVGKPLVEAIETLMPKHAAKSKIDFGPETGFVIDMERMKMLAGEAASRAVVPDAEELGDPPDIRNRADVAVQLSALDEFYRVREPASPVPLLLFRARAYLEKDFAALVAEIVPLNIEKES